MYRRQFGLVLKEIIIIVIIVVAAFLIGGYLTGSQKAVTKATSVITTTGFPQTTHRASGNVEYLSVGSSATYTWSLRRTRTSDGSAVSALSGEPVTFEVSAGFTVTPINATTPLNGDVSVTVTAPALGQGQGFLIAWYKGQTSPEDMITFEYGP